MAQTPLDVAHVAMMAAPEADAPRRAYWSQLLGSELHVLLAAEPQGDAAPVLRVQPVSDGRFALVFDSAARLGAFLDAPAPTASLSGRRLVAMLAGQDVGIGLNLGVADSATLLPPAAVDWAAAQLGSIESLDRAPARIDPPRAEPALIAALDARLAAMSGLADAAWLAEITYTDGARSLALALVAVAPTARAGAVEALGEAHRLSGRQGAFDILFLEAKDAALAAFARHGLGFAIPVPPRPARPAAPGSDPNRPPRLR
ncbi:MAG: SseB family protein [Pseudomonadota bacterium]